MTTYETTRPKARFNLAHTSLEDWAAQTYDRLIALGCSHHYANAVRRRIRRAKAV